MGKTRKITIVFVAIFIALGLVNPGAYAKSEEIDVCKLTLLTVDFSDQPHVKDYSEVSNEFFGKEGETVHTFWNLASSGKQEILPGDFVPDGWYRAPKELRYYAKDTEDDFDIRRNEVLNWALEKAISDGLEIDYENGFSYPGYNHFWFLKDLVIVVVVAGPAEGYTNYPRDDAFWPCRGRIRHTREGDERVIMIDMVLVTEDMSHYGDGAKVSSHEVGHVLGLADLYDYHCGGPTMGNCTYPFTYYDIMVARHGGQGLTGLHREKFGWLEPTEITGVGVHEVKIPPIITNEKNAYVKIPIAGTKEILALEYRIKDGIDAFWGGIPSEGLIAYRINERTNYWNNTDWDDTGEQYAILFNPRDDVWHTNPCYTSDDISIISPETNPSTNAKFGDNTENITIEVLSEDSSGVNVRITIEPREHIEITTPDIVKAGFLHDRKIKIEIENPLDRELKINSAYLADEITLPPKEKYSFFANLRIPDDDFKCRDIPIAIYFEYEGDKFSKVIILENVIAQIDTNYDGKIDSADIEKIFESLDRNEEDSRFDVNEDGEVTLEDVLICAKYIGVTYYP
ncbi:MAG: hypothetical protein R2883_08340 [Caldisericia bacterium]